MQQLHDVIKLRLQKVGQQLQDAEAESLNKTIADCTTGEKVRSLYNNEWFVDFPCSIDLQSIVIFSATRQFSTVILISNVQLEGT